MSCESIRLRKYQQDCCDFLNSNTGSLVRLPCGAGKTLIAIYWAERHTSIKKTLIICPSSVKKMWYSNITEHTNKSACILEGRYDAHTAYKFNLDADYIILNYDILFYPNKKVSWCDILINLGFDLLLLDEAHKVKGDTSNKTIAVLEMSKKITYRLLLTATPVLNSPKDLYTLFKIMDSEYNIPFEKYANRYCPPTLNRRGFLMYNDSQNESELAETLSYFMFNREDKEIFKQMPDYTRIPYFLELSNINKILGKQMMLAEAKNQELMLATIRYEIGMQKVPAIIDWVENWFLDNTSIEKIDNTIVKPKLTLWLYHRDVVEAIYNHFKSKAVIYYGGLTPTQRNNALNDFINKPHIELFVANIDAAGTGVDGLQHVACDAVIGEFPLTPATLTQAVGRIRRINSKFPVYRIHYLIAENTIEEVIVKMLDNKTRTSTQIVNNVDITPKDLLGFIMKRR